MWGTFGGWLLGFVLVLMGAISLEGLGVEHAQFMVGVGMGLGVGLAQARVGRGWIREPKAWVLASTVGMGGTFVILELVGVFIGGFGPVPVTVPALVLGSIVVGLMQRPALGEDRGWVIASLLGWSLAGLTAIGGTSLVQILEPGRWISFGLNLGLLLGGGLVLGAITGVALTRSEPKPFAGTRS